MIWYMWGHLDAFEKIIYKVFFIKGGFKLDINVPKNVFWIILSIVVATGIILAFIQWRRVREAQSNVKFLEKQAELKKIELVQKDMENQRMVSNVLPKEEQWKLIEIRKGTTDLINKANFLHNEINEKVTALEAKTEYIKLLKLLKDIDKK